MLAPEASPTADAPRIATSPYAPPDAAPAASAVGASREGRPSFQRRRWMIDKNYQWRYIVHLCLIAVLMAIAGAMATLGLRHSVSETEVAEDLSRLLLGFGAVVALIIPFLAVIQSHRVAGPLYRLRAEMDRIARGELDMTVHLRRFDHLKDTAAAFNAMVEALRLRRQLDAQAHSAADAAIAAALEILRSGTDKEFPEALRLLEEARGEFAGGRELPNRE